MKISRNPNKIDKKIRDMRIELLKIKNVGAYTQLFEALCKRCLTIAVAENNCCEVAICCNVQTDKCIVYKGDESHVRIDNKEINVLAQGVPMVVVLCHNHPSSFYFSYADIISFVDNSNLKYMIAVGNFRNVYYMEKTDSFDYNKALEIERISENQAKQNNTSPRNEFLKRAYKCGILFERIG